MRSASPSPSAEARWPYHSTDAHSAASPSFSPTSSYQRDDPMVAEARRRAYDRIAEYNLRPHGLNRDRFEAAAPAPRRFGEFGSLELLVSPRRSSWLTESGVGGSSFALDASPDVDAYPQGAPLWRPERQSHAFMQHYAPLEKNRLKREVLMHDLEAMRRHQIRQGGGGALRLPALEGAPSPRMLYSSRPDAFVGVRELRQPLISLAPFGSLSQPDRLLPARRLCPVL